MAKMTVDEMIRKFNCELAEKDGQKGIRVWGKITKSQADQLRTAKPEVMAELEKRETAKQAKEAAKKAEELAELEGLKSGTILIKASYCDGEYLMGYEVFGQAAKLLEETGAVEYVSGWGYHVPEKMIEALGKEFTYQAVVEYMRPAKEADEAKKTAKEAEYQAKFAEARETSEKVILRKWTTDCCDPREECSMDIHCEYAMPDGTTTHEWTHTW